MTAVDHSPARLSGAMAVAAAGMAVVTLGTGAAAALGVLGLLGLALGALRGSRRAVTIGAFAVFAGVAVAGWRGAAPEGLLVGTIATVLAWDLGEQAVNVGEQLGRAADTRRGELAHAAGSLLVASFAGVVGLAIFRAGSGGQPMAALVFLLLSGLALLSALRE